MKALAARRSTTCLLALETLSPLWLTTESERYFLTSDLPTVDSAEFAVSRPWLCIFGLEVYHTQELAELPDGIWFRII